MRPSLSDHSHFDESTLFEGRGAGWLVDGTDFQVRQLNIFDACHVGVVLRAVLFVEAVMAVGAMFLAYDWMGWMFRFSILTSGALPATLGWLLAACGLKRMLAGSPQMRQWVVGVGLGGVAGIYACGLLVLLDFAGTAEPAPWLASTALGALLSAALVAGLVWRAKAQTPAATAARLTALQSRIRPHFLFNTLNSAIALVRAEPLKAEAVLEDLSELFRQALADPAESVTLGQEITLAQRYLAIEKVRFGERLQIDWDLDPAAAMAQLPPLLLQPLVENAVRHGVEPSADGARVKISTHRRSGSVIIKVTNTCPAGVGTAGHGLALANVQERLVLLHDMQARFQIRF